MTEEPLTIDACFASHEGCATPANEIEALGQLAERALSKPEQEAVRALFERRLDA